MKIFTSLFLILIHYVVAGQDTTAILLTKEKAMFTAVCTGDKQAAEQMFAADYITINADGQLQSRAEMMATFGKFKGSTFRLSGQQIRRYGNTAIITGKAKFYMKSLLAAAVYYTEVWIVKNNDWQFAGWQGTMTGLPSWYPVIGIVILMLLLFTAVRWVARRLNKKTT